jgi:deoxyadenosine/deoxycytidine kinase
MDVLTSRECPYIVVAGDIASGKTTLTRALAEVMSLPALLEEPDRNPFLRSFYKDPARWALRSQLWFALDTLQQQIIAKNHGGIQDHSVFEVVDVFAAALRDAGHMSREDFKLLQRAVELAEHDLQGPHLVLLLHTPLAVLQQRIADRSRDYENAISPMYLEKLAQARRDLFAHWTLSPVLHIDTERYDARKRVDVEEIARQARGELLVPA